MNLGERLKRLVATTLNMPEWWREEIYIGRSTTAGISVNANNAIRVSAVNACVKVISESVAQLPVHLYRRLPQGGKEKAVDHPLYGVLHDLPNDFMTAGELMETACVNLGLGGMAYHWIERTGRGQIKSVEPIEPHKVQIWRNDDSGRVFYKVDGDSTPVPAEKIWRVKGWGSDKYVGLPPVDVSREAIALAIAGEQRAGALHKNAALPSGVVKTAAGMGPEALRLLKKSFADAYSGVGESGNTLFLDAGMDFQALSHDPQKSQFMESRRFQIQEIARTYRVPLHMIGDLERATFSNIEQQSIEFVVYTLGPWLRRIEQSITRDLILPSERGQYFVKFNVNSLLRGDIAARFDAYNKAILSGWLNRNEVRELEDFNIAPGLDEFVLQPGITSGQGGNEGEE
jgi:HK97 family phage portal protein